MARTARTRVIGSWVLVLIFILGAFAGFSSVSAQEGYYVYDDFNDGVINTDLWEVSGPAYENNGKIILYTDTRITALNKNLIGMSFSAIGHQTIRAGDHVDISVGTSLPDGSEISAGIIFDDNRIENKSVAFCQWRDQYGVFEWADLLPAQWGDTYTFGLEYTSRSSILVWINGQVMYSFSVPGADILYSQGGTSFWFQAWSVIGDNNVIAEIFRANAKFIPPQRCVGAEGSQCAWPVRLNRDGSYTGTVSVGSILHDNCCIANYPHGYMCNNGGADQNVCRDEWNKAISNVITRRGWTEKSGWGPYAEGEGDDITIMPARRSEPQANYETAKTLEFAAPPNTRLDITDEDFCESKRFKRREPKRGFGICE